jgi:regulator of PEP synthase PpsR (kinase-PPPase family)
MRTREDVRAVVQRAATEGGVIVHTLVMEELRDAMLEEGRSHQVETIDLMGPLLSRLSLRLRVSPHSQPGLFRKMDEDYYRRIEAVDYTVKHDDGQSIQDLPRSDIVILGVSRTCKTPLSIYLAYRGWRVANVPMVEVAGLPAIIDKVRSEAIVALTMRPDSLVKVRSNRLRRIGQHLPGHYNDHDTVENETRWARRLYRERGWPVIDVTNKSIEEIATEVISLVRRRRTDPPGVALGGP